MRRLKVFVAIVLSMSLALGNAAVSMAQESTEPIERQQETAGEDTADNGIDGDSQTPVKEDQKPAGNGGSDNNTQDSGQKSDVDETQSDSVESGNVSEGENVDTENNSDQTTDQQPAEEQMPVLSYRIHMQTKGWNNWTEYEYSEQIGSTGQGKRLEAIALKMEDAIEEQEEPVTEEPAEGQEESGDNTTVSGTETVETPATDGNTESTDTSEGDQTVDENMPVQEEEQGGIEYRVHGQTYGWQGWKSDGEIAGSTGQAKRIEAIQIRLTGKYKEKYDIYYRVHSQTYGWLDWAKNGQKAGSLAYAKRLEALEIRLVEKDGAAPGETANHYLYPKISYQAHSQSYGWRTETFDNAVAGVTGQAKRLEALKIKLPDTGDTQGDGTSKIRYRVYLQGTGWQDWKENGAIAGTTGQKKRIEAIEMHLEGPIAEEYDVYYSVHMAKIGWSAYVKGNPDPEAIEDIVGTKDLSKGIEAVKIQMVKKGDPAPSTSGTKYIEGYQTSDLTYAGTIQGQGMSNAIVQGNTLGTTGQKKRLENIVINLNRTNELTPTGGIQYSVHLQTSGWGGWVDQGTVAGCTDGTKRMEAIKIKLTGDLANYYDIWYRTHVEKYGWLGWAKNGQAAGTTKCAYRIEGIQIRLVSKDATAPGKNSGYYTEQKYNIGPDAGMYAQVNLYSSSTPYIIAVNRGTRKVGIYQGWRGNWRNIQYWSCTVGAPSTPTVGGVFRVGNRGHYFDSGASRCFWWTQFYGNYLFHSTLYNRNGVPTDSRLGMALSHGCVRLNINNALWIYNNIPRGTTVIVYN